MDVNIKSEKPQLFGRGEIVRIVDTPNYDCPFGWVDEMDRCCGKDMEIESVNFSESNNEWAYTLKGDQWVWHDSCFVHQETDLADADGDISLLLS